MIVHMLALGHNQFVHKGHPIRHVVGKLVVPYRHESIHSDLLDVLALAMIVLVGIAALVTLRLLGHSRGR